MELEEMTKEQLIDRYRTLWVCFNDYVSCVGNAIENARESLGNLREGTSENYGYNETDQEHRRRIWR